MLSAATEGQMVLSVLEASSQIPSFSRPFWWCFLFFFDPLWSCSGLRFGRGSLNDPWKRFMILTTFLLCSLHADPCLSNNYNFASESTIGQHWSRVSHSHAQNSTNLQGSRHPRIIQKQIWGPRPKRSWFGKSRAGPKNEYIFTKLRRWFSYISRSYNQQLVSRLGSLRKLRAPQGCSRELQISLLMGKKAFLFQSCINWWPTDT